MKKTAILVLCTLALAPQVFAQDDAVKKAAEDAAKEIADAPVEEVAPVKPSYWTNSLAISVGFSNTKLDNWAAGGYNTATLTSSLDAKADYARNLMSWNNRLQLDYGFLSSGDKEGILQKSNDRIYLESKWAYKPAAAARVGFTASYDFRSQFTDTPKGYEQDTDGKWHSQAAVSGFLSPAYTNIALGLEWVPSSWFNINVAPLTGGVTIVTDEALRSSYGMKVHRYDTDGTTPLSYNSALFQFGAQVKANVKFSLNDVFTFESQGTVFTDYLSEPYFRINWDNAINWQLSKLITLSFKTWMINDPLVTVTKTNDAGEEYSEKRGWQFKEFLSFSFTYKIANK